MSRSAITWLSIIGLLLVGIGLGLIAAPQVALQYWYLLSVPIILAALHFGLRGALAAASGTVLVLVAVFQAAGQTFSQVITQVTGVLADASETSASLEGVSQLALQLADLGAADPRTTYARALMGLVLTIAIGIVLGLSVDARERANRTLQRVSTQLRSYVSPRILDTIIQQEGAGDLSAISARMEVTILFADLRDFTALSERLESDEVVALLNEFFSAMTEEILEEGGTVDKYIGDEVMAFFGAPTWQPDHPERAFHAAIAMQQRMRELHSRWRTEGRETVGMGIGISTGHATIGNTGSPSRMEYTAIGSTVNIASRLTDLAREGQIITTRKTYWRVQQMVDGIPREPTTVKGFSQPIELVEVVGTRLVTREGETPHSHRLEEIVAQVMEDSAFRALLLGRPEEAARIYALDQEERSLAQHVATLSGYPVFQAVPAQEIAILMAAASLEQYEEGTVIVQQGALEDKLYIILRGDVVVTVVDEMGREHHIASASRGDYFGEVALLFDTPRTATVRAVSPLTLLVLHQEAAYHVLRQAPALRSKIEATARSRMSQPLTARRPAEVTPDSPTPDTARA